MIGSCRVRLIVGVCICEDGIFNVYMYVGNVFEFLEESLCICLKRYGGLTLALAFIFVNLHLFDEG